MPGLISNSHGPHPSVCSQPVHLGRRKRQSRYQAPVALVHLISLPVLYRFLVDPHGMHTSSCFPISVVLGIQTPGLTHSRQVLYHCISAHPIFMH